jgi:hypothetical protein
MGRRDRRCAARCPQLWRAQLAAWLTGALVPSLSLAAPALQLSASTDYSTGHYGQNQSTDAIIEAISAKVLLNGWMVRGTLPFASIRGTGDVTVLSDENGSEPQDGAAEEQDEGTGQTRPAGFRSGLSDISLAVSRQFNGVLARSLYIDATAKVRLPTGSPSRGLGVGATDYFLSAEFGGDWKPGGAYVGLGRRLLGAVPQVDRRDGWQGSVGGWLNTGSRTQVGTAYDWRQSSLAGVDAYQAVQGYVSYRLNPKLRIQLFAGAGLSRNSQAFDAGVSFIFRPLGPDRRPR